MISPVAFESPGPRAYQAFGMKALELFGDCLVLFRALGHTGLCAVPLETVWYGFVPSSFRVFGNRLVQCRAFVPLCGLTLAM